MANLGSEISDDCIWFGMLPTKGPLFRLTECWLLQKVLCLIYCVSTPLKEKENDPKSNSNGVYLA